MAHNTSKTYLMYKPSASYEKLIDIVNYPDLGSSPNKLDATTLSNSVMKTTILGLMEAPDLEFECNYDEDAYELIDALTGEQDLAVYFGENGANGKFGWKGTVSVFISGGGVDEVRKMMVTCSASTQIEKLA